MVMHMDMGGMAMEVMVMEVMAMDMVKVMAMAMAMATEDTQMKKTLNILKKMKVSTSVPRVIAEIGCNHMGDFDLAKKMITKASDCGAYAVKFQKRCVEEKINDEI